MRFLHEYGSFSLLSLIFFFLPSSHHRFMLPNFWPRFRLMEKEAKARWRQMRVLFVVLQKVTTVTTMMAFTMSAGLFKETKTLASPPFLAPAGFSSTSFEPPHRLGWQHILACSCSTQAKRNIEAHAYTHTHTHGLVILIVQSCI